LAVANAPEVALFSVGPGPTVTIVGAVVMVVGLVTPAVIARRFN
jgi:ABC-type Mn2+/Zn2+ transport system permease subunit